VTVASIRLTVADDSAALRKLYQRAFPDEDLVPLVSALLSGSWPVLSLAVVNGSGLSGHVAFTACGGSAGKPANAALLAPLAVAPEVQGQGLGSRLVRAGLSDLQRSGVGQVFVLGAAGYYSRFGFVPERHILPPYPMPPAYAEAWQSLLLPGAALLPAGPLVLPTIWLQPALWLP
jgi:putative acetyltransferase